MKPKIIVLLLFFPLVTMAQLVITPDTDIVNGNTVKVVLNIAGDISLPPNSISTDLSKWSFVLTGANQTLSTTATDATTLSSLEVNGGGNKTFNGNWIFPLLTLTEGILIPSSSGKITYTGSPALKDNASSYVSGALFIQNLSGKTGSAFFPIGTATTYAPAGFSGIAGESTIGMQASDGLPPLTKKPEAIELKDIFPDRYWQMTVDNGSAPDATIFLSTPPDVISFQGESGLAILEATQPNGDANNLESSSAEPGFVSSKQKISGNAIIFALATTTAPPVLSVHNAITPNTDGVNDFLYIDNIDFYSAENTVTLLDRWGVVQKQWKNFKNFNDTTNPPDFDFGAKLSNGNYICTVEYVVSGETKTESQMITVIK